jgi:hypothetical protein
MPTHQTANTPNDVASGEIATAFVWLVFYAVILAAPIISNFAPVGTAVAFLSH